MIMNLDLLTTLTDLFMSLGSQYFAKIPVVVIQNVIEDINVFDMILPFCTVPVLLIDALYHKTKHAHLVAYIPISNLLLMYLVFSNIIYSNRS